VSTTAKLDGDEYVINGEKIFVTAGSRATHIVVWATLDKSLGRSAIKSFIVPREHPGVTVERLENKLGIKGSDTAVIRFDNARIPKDNLLGNPEIAGAEKGFAGVMETFDLEELRKILTEAGVEISYDKPSQTQSAAAAEFLRMEADWEASYLLMLRAAWQADNKIPNSKEASMAKAKAGRVGSDITLKAVEIAGTTGYSEETLLEKWARDSKIMDIFEGTQQIQQLVVARRLLGLSSSELK
jgi:acyl-CoA dehydrogenase